jgi:hypothetical protein
MSKQITDLIGKLKKDKNLKSSLEKLTKETRMAGAAEFTTLVEFFNGLAENEKDVEVFKASCDEFIVYATLIKKELSNV